MANPLPRRLFFPPTVYSLSTSWLGVWVEQKSRNSFPLPITPVSSNIPLYLSANSVYLFFFSKVQNDEKMSSYKDFCKNMEQQSIESYLMADLRVSQFTPTQTSVYGCVCVCVWVRAYMVTCVWLCLCMPICMYLHILTCFQFDFHFESY